MKSLAAAPSGFDRTPQLRLAGDVCCAALYSTSARPCRCQPRLPRRPAQSYSAPSCRAGLGAWPPNKRGPQNVPQRPLADVMPAWLLPSYRD